MLAAAPHMCISSELLPLFLFYLASPHCATARYCTMRFRIRIISGLLIYTLWAKNFAEIAVSRTV